MTRAKSLQNSWEKLNRSNRLVIVELQKIFFLDKVCSFFQSCRNWPICGFSACTDICINRIGYAFFSLQYADIHMHAHIVKCICAYEKNPHSQLYWGALCRSRMMFTLMMILGLFEAEKGDEFPLVVNLLLPRSTVRDAPVYQYCIFEHCSKVSNRCWKIPHFVKAFWHKIGIRLA